MTLVERGGFEAVRRVVGDKQASRISHLYRDRIQPAGESITYKIDPAGTQLATAARRSARRVCGKRCFIIGNGPSLAGDGPVRPQGRIQLWAEPGLSPLRSHRRTDDLHGGSQPIRRRAVRVGSDRGSIDDLRQLAITGMDPYGTDVTFVRRSRLFTFATDVAQGAWEGATVTYVALQLAFHLGFEEVILIGVDHSFATTGPANKLVTATESRSQPLRSNLFRPRCEVAAARLGSVRGCVPAGSARIHGSWAEGARRDGGRQARRVPEGGLPQRVVLKPLQQTIREGVYRPRDVRTAGRVRRRMPKSIHRDHWSM